MIFASLRMMGLLRRGVRALESLAKSQTILAHLAEQQVPQPKPRPRPTELGVVDTVEVERRYQEQLVRDNVERG